MEQSYLLEKFRPKAGQRFWIAATGQPHTDRFSSLDHRSLNGYTNWLQKPPVFEEGGCYAVTFDVSGRWSRASCDEQHAVICERPVTYDLAFVPGPFGKEYHVSDVESTGDVDYETARQRCHQMKAKLVIVSGEKEMDWLDSEFDGARVWTAGRLAFDGVWVWANGEEIDRRDIKDFDGYMKPAECLLADGSYREQFLHARPCDEGHRFICERPKIYVAFLNEAVLDIESRLELVELFARESRDELDNTKQHFLSYFQNATSLVATDGNSSSSTTTSTTTSSNRTIADEQEEVVTLERYLFDMEEQINQVNAAVAAAVNQSAWMDNNDRLQLMSMRKEIAQLREQLEHHIQFDERRVVGVACVQVLAIVVMSMSMVFCYCNFTNKLSAMAMATRAEEFGAIGMNRVGRRV